MYNSGIFQNASSVLDLRASDIVHRPLKNTVSVSCSPLALPELKAPLIFKATFYGGSSSWWRYPEQGWGLNLLFLGEDPGCPSHLGVTALWVGSQLHLCPSFLDVAFLYLQLWKSCFASPQVVLIVGHTICSCSLSVSIREGELRIFLLCCLPLSSPIQYYQQCFLNGVMQNIRVKQLIFLRPNFLHYRTVSQQITESHFFLFTSKGNACSEF